MSKTAIICLIAFMLAAGFASAASIYTSTAATEDNFCFGYAICE